MTNFQRTFKLVLGFILLIGGIWCFWFIATGPPTVKVKNCVITGILATAFGIGNIVNYKNKGMARKLDEKIDYMFYKSPLGYYTRKGQMIRHREKAANVTDDKAEMRRKIKEERMRNGTWAPEETSSTIPLEEEHIVEPEVLPPENISESVLKSLLNRN